MGSINTENEEHASMSKISITGDVLLEELNYILIETI